MPEQAVQKKITFAFNSHKLSSSMQGVEKSDTAGIKRRYVAGIASGIKIDAHLERLTQKCIKAFMDQANSGQVLLFPDVHNVRATDDIGILTKAEIQSDGDWMTEFRLYDETDDVDQRSKEIAKKEWAQMNGLPPYMKPRPKGFSIEGVIPDGGILSVRKGPQGKDIRVLDNILLDGVVLVPRPAYQASVATAVYKALGEITPESAELVRKNIRDTLQSQINVNEMENAYHRKKWDAMNALENTIEKIMKRDAEDKNGALDIIFDEYKNIMIELILQSAQLFRVEDADADEPPQEANESGQRSRVEVLKALRSEFIRLKKFYGGQHELYS